MISELDTIEIIRNLENNDISKAKEIISGLKKPESSYEKGYIHALKGLISSCENKEQDSIFMKLINNELPPSSIDYEGEYCAHMLSQKFRPGKEIGYCHAWEFILSYFSGNTKTGLDKYQS